MATGEPSPKRISATMLDTVLEQARAEGWRELALVGPNSRISPTFKTDELRTFLLERPLGDDGSSALQTLTNLSSLDVSGNGIGDKGARALATLTNLTSLNLSLNNIRSNGACALTTLTNLSVLDASHNRIGYDGSRAIGKLTNLTSLYIRDNMIGDEGTFRLATLTNLSSLDVSYNEIGDRGAHALRALTNLASLYVRDNMISGEGARALATLTDLSLLAIGRNKISVEGMHALEALTNLSSFDASYNQIEDDGAWSLAMLTNLSSLDISYNEIGDDGACVLEKLTSLCSLYVRGNRIENKGASALKSLTNLSSLDISYNKIGDGGACAIAALSNLSSLDIGNNEIGNGGARALAALPSLTSLRARANRIDGDGAHALLEAWCEGPRSEILRQLDLRNNGDLSTLLPAELLESTDAQAILAAYRSYREARRRNTLRPLNEAKLIVVGNEAVGKTSLIRYLVQDKARDPDEQRTAGAALHEKIAINTWSPRQSQVRLNVWDFGGQEIMRGTHRFFLTERSLYLLVLEDRREDDRSIYEWLEIIAQRGGDSPVIVVINKSDRKRPRLLLDEETLQRDYPAIVSFARTSCNPGDAAAQSIAALRDRIVAVLAESDRLRHVRDPIPLSWQRIKETIALQAREHSVLPVGDFEKMCESNVGDEPIGDAHAQRALLGLLHDLGTVVAHGLRHDVPAAWCDITILDPNWLTGAIYALIDSPQVLQQGGELHQGQLTELLDPARYPAKWHELILGMMQEPAFGLCFPLAHADPPRYLLPHALPVKEPFYEVWPTTALRYRFEYALLPQGFIPRLIVQAYGNLTQSPTWWRTGVVLSAERCNILVRADVRRNRVDIAVAGETGQRAALHVVRDHCLAVHRYYAKLTFKERVPLPDHPEVDVGYEHLTKLEMEKGLDYMHYPEDARREYSVRELLEGVRETADSRERKRGGHRSENEAPSYRSDVAVLVPLQEEFRVWFSHLQQAKPETLEHQTYYSTSRNQRSLVTTFIGDMGPTPASAVAAALLRNFRPRILVVIGIAGALKKEIALGDVIVATGVDAYLDSGKATGNDDLYELKPGGTSFRAEPRLVNLVRNLEFQHAELHRGWQSACEDRASKDAALQEAKVPLTPTLHNGIIASGPFVAASEPFRKWLLRRERSYKAVEMEAAGAHWAAERAPDPKPALLVIRGISDDASPNKTNLDNTGAGAIRRHAMHNAIDLLLTLIDNGLLFEKSPK